MLGVQGAGWALALLGHQEAGRCFNLGSTREAIKYKNTVSQKTSYRDTELQIQVLTSKISREERKPG